MGIDDDSPLKDDEQQQLKEEQQEQQQIKKEQKQQQVEEQHSDEELFDLFSSETFFDEDESVEEIEEHIRNRIIDIYSEIEDTTYLLDPIWKRIITKRTLETLQNIHDVIIELGIDKLPPHSLLSLFKLSKLNISKKVLERVENRI